MTLGIVAKKNRVLKKLNSLICNFKKCERKATTEDIN